MSDDASYLNALLSQTTLSVTAEQKRQLLAYVELMSKWNAAYNLTSVRDKKAMIVRHLLDSLVVAPYLRGKTFIDVGTGPGLPGIPLAIMQPENHFVLLDSLGKRVRFLKQAQHELALSNIEPIQSRVETFDYAAPFDGVISRAFASLKEMVNWCQHLTQSEIGRFYALKGIYPHQELEELPTNITLDYVHKLTVPDLSAERHLVIMRKNDNLQY